MSYLAISYPELEPNDFEKIQQFRKARDFQYKLIEPHFTLVFPTAGFQAQTFSAEITKQAAGTDPFDFCLRCATINKDAFSERYHIFLVPDEGFSKILKLHDQLYADQLSPYRSLDIDYVPHITIGNTKDPQLCLDMVNQWNQTDFEIWGQIKQLDLIESAEHQIRTVATLNLSR